MPGDPTVREVDERELFAPRADFARMPLAEGARTPPPAPAHAAGWLALPQSARAVARSASKAFPKTLMLEYERGTAFLFIPVAMAAGVFAYLALPVEPSVWMLAGLTLLIGAGALAARSSVALSCGLMLAGALVAGATFARLETALAATRMVGSEISTRLTGRVVRTDFLANGRVRFTLDVLATERPRLRFAPDRVRLSAPSAPKGLVSGMMVAGFARLFPPSGPLRPGAYNFAYESYFDGLGGNGFFFRAPELIVGEQSASLVDRFRFWADNTRNSMARHIEAAVDGKAEGEIVAALIVGTRAGIPEDVNESLRRTGLAHILSISGLHMALVAASIMGVMRLALALYQPFASRHAVKKAAALIALAAITGYLFISGAEVAAQRSYIMLAVMLLAVQFDRAALTMRNLAIAAIVTLVISPHEVVGPSFQMSFAATAALIGGYQVWFEYRRKQRRRRQPQNRNIVQQLGSGALRILGAIAATSVLAGLATTIFGVWHFQRVSPLSLFANLAVSPVITLAMWTGVLAAAASPFGLDGPLFALMGKLIGVMLGISAWLSERSPIDAVGAIPASSVVLFTLALVIAALASTWLRWVALVPLALGLIVTAGRSNPDLLVSEDAKLVALTSEGTLAVNRARPNAFTFRNWQRATAAQTVLKPGKGGGVGFICADGVCRATKNGTLLAHTTLASQAMAHCYSVSLIISADATTPPCPPGGAFVVSARDLAQKGGATVNLSADAPPQVTFSIRQPYRPWHEHRRFSRAARGMAPFVPRQKSDQKTAEQPQ
jgi:ComEC/Rec2-related protein